MAKVYKLVFHFKDGKSWDYESHGVSLSANQIAHMLDEQQKNDRMEVTNDSTGEKKKVSEIKSIELLF